MTEEEKKILGELKKEINEVKALYKPYNKFAAQVKEILLSDKDEKQQLSAIADALIDAVKKVDMLSSGMEGRDN